MASDHPERFSYDRTNFVGTHLRIGPDGVFVADQRVADAGQIVERIARDDVRSIVRPVRRRGSKWGAVGGAAVGAWLGVGVAVVQATTPCGESCRDEKARAWASSGCLSQEAFSDTTGLPARQRRSSTAHAERA